MERLRSRAAAVGVFFLLSACTSSRPLAPPTTGSAGEPSGVSPSPSIWPRVVWRPQVALAFRFDRGVTAPDRSAIKIGIRQAVPLFPYPHRPVLQPVPITVFGHSTNGQMTRPNEVAEVRRQSIHVFVQSRGWRTAGEVQRREAMFHEWVHIVQQIESPFVPGPVWLVEGSAEWAAWDAVIRRGLVSRSQVRTLAVGVADRIPLAMTLRHMEGLGFYRNDTEGSNYTLAYLAVDHLHPVHGWRTLISFYQVLGQIKEWRTAFHQVFGRFVSGFYRNFESFRAGGFTA